MILRLKEDKKLSFYQKNPIYIGEKDFDIIEVLIPPKVDNNNTEDLNFILHIVNKKGEYIHINLEKEQRSGGVVGITKVDATITNETQDFFLYLEMVKGEKEIIGKTNCVEITIEPLPDEDTRIIPKEEYEEIIDELTEIIQKNTDAMNRINEFEDGKSAYEIAVEHGYKGTEEEWLSEMKDYSKLNNKPSINNIELNGNKTTSDLGLQDKLTAGNNITIENNVISAEGGGSQIVSGVVNSNGTITFTDSEGNSFTTSGESVIGAEGFSPSATVQQTASGATITVTDKNGTTTANISNGAPGQDYVLTAQDKADIANIVLSELPTTEGVLYGNQSN